jgi:organic radical activating enzyme
MHCEWCDTPASIGDGLRVYQSLSACDVLNQVNIHLPHIHSVSLTGGEPLLQWEFLGELVKQLEPLHKGIHLETNGTLPEALEAVISGMGVVAMDIKLPSSTKGRSYWDEHHRFLEIALKNQTEVFVKVVISTSTEEADVVLARDLICSVDPLIPVILQPNSYELKSGVLADCLSFQKVLLPSLPLTRVIPQVHKFLKIP